MRAIIAAFASASRTALVFFKDPYLAISSRLKMWPQIDGWFWVSSRHV